MLTLIVNFPTSLRLNPSLSWKRAKDMLKRYGCKTLSYPFGEYNDSVLEHAKKHYIAARGYFQQTAVKRNFGYNQNVDDNRYESKVFPMEHAFPSENVSLVDLPLDKFKNMIEEIVNNCVKHGSWGIFVFHGPKARASAKDMINILLRKPLHTISTVDNISKMAKQSQIEDSLLKFKTFCDLLVSKDRIKIMSVSEVIENLKWGSPHQKGFVRNGVCDCGHGVVKICPRNVWRMYTNELSR